ncbi:carbonic anhydrase-like [Pecten maximus]|uniref:carbonic anhydrase-like n=1 Tax=Pecten maximus TaxID=6579 RepID=UPI0014584FCA|nr:carbonic anhydrase-like [Pecten maximus]
MVGKYVEKIQQPDEKTPADIKPYAVLPKNLHYYTYSGSLTTPPCTEHVRWIVMQEPVIISQESITTLRSLYGHKGLMSEDGNRRPVQRQDTADVSVGELKH